MTEKHFADKTFADCHKNAKFAKVFSLKSFRLYGMPMPSIPVAHVATYCIHYISMAACIAGASSGALSLSANVATFTVTVCYNCISLYAVSSFVAAV